MLLAHPTGFHGIIWAPVAELKNLQADLTLWQVTTLPITKAISERAVRLVEEHFLAHHLQLADALIAATAIEHKLVIVTSAS